MLIIKNLSKTFKTKKVLDNISLTVDKGSIAVFLGASGVGKSTLLRALNNLETLDHGTIELNGQKLDIKQANQQHRIGMVFQQFNLFEHLTVQENITLALEKVLKKSSQEASSIAHNLLKKYGLADKVNLYPSSLSGGQKQRLALARSLALKPEIICLDEPTSALDPLLTNYVAGNIKKLAHDGYIVLVATHDVAILNLLDCTIYLMRDGRIVETAHSYEFVRTKEHFPQIKAFVEGVSICVQNSQKCY